MTKSEKCLFILKENKIDFVVDIVIGVAIGQQFGWAVGFFAFGVLHTLNQIFWLLMNWKEIHGEDINVHT